MQEEEKNNGMEGMSVEEMFLGVQESYQEAQLRAQEENRAFARTEFFRMDKFGTYRLRILPIAPNPDGSPTRPGYEYPVHQLLLELEKPATGNKPQKMYVTVTRATDAGYSVDPIETYRRMAVEAAKEDGDDKLAEKIAGGSFGGGLKYSYGHCLYVFDLGERAKGVQMMTLSHAQFKDLDERKFKLWSKKLAKNPSYPCPISSVYDAYPVEIEKRKNGAKTEYVISIDNESEPVPLTKEELTALMGAPRIPEIIYRYTRYHLGATVEFLKQCDGIYGMSLMETDEMKTVIDTLAREAQRPDVHKYMSYQGEPILRKAFADWYKKFYGVDLDWKTEVYPLIGSKEGLMHVCMTFLNEGDKVLVPNPGYPTYSAAVKLAGGASGGRRNAPLCAEQADQLLPRLRRHRKGRAGRCEDDARQLSQHADGTDSDAGTLRADRGFRRRAQHPDRA